MNLRHPVDLAGSGTLVELGGRHFILTADHVWDETEEWDELGLVLASEGAPLNIPRKGLSARRLGAKPYSQWGPDLALVGLPPNVVTAIAARKSFLNLARRRPMRSTHPLRLENRVWAVMGLVGEKSKVELSAEEQTAMAILKSEAFFGWSCTEERREEHDYLTVYARTTLPGVPASFKGVSGGGLWQITLRQEGDKIVSPGDHQFRGVAFWQEPVPPDRVAIRCHGPQSVFETAWKEWGLPE